MHAAGAKLETARRHRQSRSGEGFGRPRGLGASHRRAGQDRDELRTVDLIGLDPSLDPRDGTECHRQPTLDVGAGDTAGEVVELQPGFFERELAAQIDRHSRRPARQLRVGRPQRHIEPAVGRAAQRAGRGRAHLAACELRVDAERAVEGAVGLERQPRGPPLHVGELIDAGEPREHAPILGIEAAVDLQRRSAGVGKVAGAGRIDHRVDAGDLAGELEPGETRGAGGRRRDIELRGHLEGTEPAFILA